MFYSHQLLARKAPLGQIWMAATLHAKINRKRLEKLDIIKICEEILNPSVPMALRLSGILMGGVVIVYERKVKVLYDDVSRLLIEINEAWRIKPVADPTVLPKGKSQAKYEAVTLPENMMDMDVEQEQPMFFPEADPTKFRGMRLEDLDEQYVNVNLDDDDFSRTENHHQENITLVDKFDSGLGDTDVHNRFERFDITLVPSPPRQEDPPPQQEKYHASPSIRHEGSSSHEQEPQKMKGQQPAPSKRKKRMKDPQVTIDEDQIMIPGIVYQTWLKDSSSLIAKRRRINSKVNLIRSIKIGDLMDLPPVSLISSLNKSPLEFYYPKELMQLFKESAEVKSPKAPSSGYYTICSFLSPFWIIKETEGSNHHHQNNSRETHLLRHFHLSLRLLMGGKGDFTQRSSPMTSKNSERTLVRNWEEIIIFFRVIIVLLPEVLVCVKLWPKRRQQSSGKSFGNLDTVEEEFLLEQELREFKMRRLSDVGQTPDLLEEIEPTQTPYEKKSNPVDQVTESIHSYLKIHFDNPGASQFESLSQLAYGMTTAKAARLFYQACVLATLDFIKVKQLEPYGDILISRGPKM
uniref:Rad21/Rec8-like protein N-terminal domain-containing protein n=1 Tax=Leersia perrieri TaxID=77586 RepID=A0A0D9WKA1_9ORYZ